MSLEIVLLLLVLSPLISVCYSQENNFSSVGQTWVLVNTTEPVVCYEEKIAKQIILQLENAIDYKTQVEDLKLSNFELEKQIILLKEVNRLQAEQRDIANQAIESYKELLRVQKESFEKQIENQKPSVWSKIGAVLGGMGVGALLVFVLF